jgi:hypothetical protein
MTNVTRISDRRKINPPDIEKVDMYSYATVQRAPRDDGYPSPLCIALDRNNRALGLLMDDDDTIVRNDQLNEWLQQIIDLRFLNREPTKEEFGALVQAARDEDHPLHGEFEWDDAKAASELRAMALAKMPPQGEA